MKKILFIAIFLISSNFYSQKLKLNELMELVKISHKKVEPILAEKRFNLEEDSKDSRDEVNTRKLVFTYLQNNKIEEFQRIFFYFDINGNIEKNTIIYTFELESWQKNLIIEIFKNGFEYSHLLKTENGIIKYYKKENQKIGMYILKNGSYNLIIDNE